MLSPCPLLAGGHDALHFSSWRRGSCLPGLVPASCSVLPGKPLTEVTGAFLLHSGLERQGSDRQEELLLCQAPWGLGSSFRNSCGCSSEGNKKARNKEVGIPRTEILDRPWDCAKAQRCRGGVTPARASEICPQGIGWAHGILGGDTGRGWAPMGWGLSFCCQTGKNLPAVPWRGGREEAPRKTQVGRFFFF